MNLVCVSLCQPKGSSGLGVFFRGGGGVVFFVVVTFNTFYLQLYGIRYMVMVHSGSKGGNLL